MKILIATDGSKFSKAAIDEYCRLFSNLKNAEIKVLSVFEETYPITTEPFAMEAQFQTQLVEMAKRQAEHSAAEGSEILSRFCHEGAAEPTSEVLRGNPAQEIVEYAKQWHADLIVVGSHGYGFWSRTLIGSVSDAVVHHAPCSVLVVRNHGSDDVEPGDE